MQRFVVSTVWRDLCLISLLVVMFSGSVGDAQDVTVEVTEPDPPFLCPTKSAVYECTADGFVSLTWILPTNDMTPLAFSGLELPGTNKSNGIFTAFLNRSDVVGTTFSITSTLQIEHLDNLNESSLTCAGVTASSATVDRIVTIIVSDNPSPPHELHHDTLANTESSTVIQWQSSLYTGGPIIRYTVTANGQTESVSGDVFTYTVTGLDVNTDYSVEVTAVNFCGLESEPADVTVNIEARGPPLPSEPSVEDLRCDKPLSDGRGVTIKWMYGAEEDGVIYPGEVEVRVDLDPEAMGCSDVTADDTSCTATITSNDNYAISLNVTNGLDSVITMRTFDLSLFLVEREDLSPDTGLSVTVRVNPLCPDAVSYPVLASFGIQMADGCSVQQNDTDSATLGSSVTLTADPDDIPLGTDQNYCVVISSNGEIVANITDDPKDFPTIPVVIGVCAGVGFVAVIVITPGGVYIWYRKKKIRPGGKKTKRLSGHACLEAEDFPPATVTIESDATYQEPSTITRTPHPTTGEVHTDVKLDKKKREKVEVGPMYQDPSAIEHQQAASGDTYALPQKGTKGKKGTKGEVGEGERQLTEEEKAGLYSTPDRKGQKAKSDGLNYAQLDMQATSKKAPPPAGSMYVDLQHPN